MIKIAVNVQFSTISRWLKRSRVTIIILPLFLPNKHVSATHHEFFIPRESTSGQVEVGERSIDIDAPEDVSHTIKISIMMSIGSYVESKYYRSERQRSP